MDASITNILMSKLKELIEKQKELAEKQLSTNLSNSSTKEKYQLYRNLKAKIRELNSNINDMIYSEGVGKEANPEKYKQLNLEKDKLNQQLQDLGVKLNKIDVPDVVDLNYKDYSDDELIQLAEDFSNLNSKDKQSIYLGDGAFKNAYEIPGTGLVLKEGKPSTIFGEVNPSREIIQDYFGNKHTEELLSKGYIGPAKLRKKYTNILERPNLIILPEKPALQVQKKLIAPDFFTLRRMGNLQEVFENARDDISSKFIAEYRPRDLHSMNIGLDPVTNEIKAFDAMPSTMANYKMEEESADTIQSLLKSSSPKVLRAILPALKTAGKLVPLAGAYGSYAEAREEGLPEAVAMAYAASEEINPLPISGIDYFKGMEKAAEGRRESIEQNYAPEKNRVELDALKNYKNSPAAKQAAYSRIRKLLKN